MAEKEPVSLDALNGLLKERQRYEEWLAALEDKRANTPESVYQRVQGDYQTRLREVSSKLAERAGELRENIDALTIKLEDITRQETQQREARQEAELRAAVGEYTDKQWKEIGGAWDKELARLVKEKGAVDAQLNELSRIFALSVKEKQAEAIFKKQDETFEFHEYPIEVKVGSEQRILYGGWRQVGGYHVCMMHGFRWEPMPGESECGALLSVGACHVSAAFFTEQLLNATSYEIVGW